MKQADEPYKPPKIQRKAQAPTGGVKEKGGEAQLQITVIAEKDQSEPQEAQQPPQ